jgi:hypothetical protein
MALREVLFGEALRSVPSLVDGGIRHLQHSAPKLVAAFYPKTTGGVWPGPSTDTELEGCEGLANLIETER